MIRSAFLSYSRLLLKVFCARKMPQAASLIQRVLLPLALLGALTGCQERAGNSITPQPLIPVTSEAVLNWQFPSTCATKLSVKEQQKIHSFLRKNGSREGDFIIVSLPPACEPRLDYSRQTHLGHVIGQATTAGIRFIESGGFGHARHAKQSGIIRLVRVEALRAECAPPPRLSGCVQSQNLAAMTARPSDHFLAITARRYTPAKE